MPLNRVVVTGIGIISPLGLTVAETWQGLVAGRSGVGPITHFDASRMGNRIAAEVRGFDPVAYMDRKEARRTDRYAQFAVAASLQAAEGAGLKVDSSNAYDIGVIIDWVIFRPAWWMIPRPLLHPVRPDRLNRPPRCRIEGCPRGPSRYVYCICDRSGRTPLPAPAFS